MARKRVAIIGSSVGTELKTSSKALVGEEVDLGGVTFKIIGVTKSEGSSGWSNPDEQIYIPLLTASDRVFGRDRVDSIRVEVPNTYTPEEAMISIERVLRREHDIGPGEENNFRINDWSQFTDLQKQATAIFSALLIGIAGISLMVGGIGVMNIMLVSVTERTREIGLRKALGATHQAILLQFIIEAVTLCIIGGIIGVIFWLKFILSCHCFSGLGFYNTFFSYFRFCHFFCLCWFILWYLASKKSSAIRTSSSITIRIIYENPSITSRTKSRWC